MKCKMNTRVLAMLCLLMMASASWALAVPHKAYTGVEESDVIILKAIKSTGKQAFNTEYTHKANTRVEMDCDVVQDHASNWEALLGGRLNNFHNNAFCFFSRTDGRDVPCFNRSGEEPRGQGFVYGERILLICEGQTATWYRYSDLETTAGSVTTTGTADDGKTPMLLFNLNTSSTEGGVKIDTSPSVMTLYGCKIYEGETLMCDFVPAKYEGTVGLYDRVRKTFSGSITSTAFEYEEYESPLTFLDAIQSTGKQAFNTGYTHKANTRVEMDCYVVQDHASNWEALLGGRYKHMEENAFCFFSRTDGRDVPCFNRSGDEPRGQGFVYSERILLVCEGQTATWYRHSDLETEAGSVTTTGTVDDGKTPMLLFNLNTSSTEGGVKIDTSPSVMTLYGCKIYEGETLMCDFVPAQKGSVVGLYDRVNDTFSGSITSTDFLVADAEPPVVLEKRECIDDIYYILHLDTHTAEVTCVEGNEDKYQGDISIPTDVTYAGETYEVTAIAPQAFKNCSDVTSISIGDKVTSIGDGAFASCTGMYSVDIPGNVKSIGESAFYNCWRIMFAQLQTGVESIGKEAFKYCSNLFTVVIPSTVTHIGESAFRETNIRRVFAEMDSPCEIASDCFDDETYANSGFGVPRGKVSAYQAVDGWNRFEDVEEAGYRTIANADGQKIYYVLLYEGNEAEVTFKITGDYEGEVIIPETVVSDGEEFTVISIGMQAFYNCEGLTAVTIPNSVKKTWYLSFYGCTRLASVKLSSSLETIGYGSFAGCYVLPSVELPNSLKIIDDYAFAYCYALSSVEIPHSVTEIWDYAFDWCVSLKSITIPSSVETIGENPFWGCYDLTAIEVEDDNAVYDSRNGCNAIIETATNTLLSGCQTTKIPDTVTSIGLGGFGGIESLTSIDIPNSVTAIGLCAFEFCSGLISVKIPNSVTLIDEEAFYGCENLLFVEIPNSVTAIGEYAFDECYSLKTIRSLIEEPFAINEDTFSEDTYDNATLYVPKGTIDAYLNTESWNRFNITEDEIPTGIQQPEEPADREQYEVYDLMGHRVVGNSSTRPHLHPSTSNKGVYILRPAKGGKPGKTVVVK